VNLKLRTGERRRDSQRALRRQIADLTARNGLLMDACDWFTDRLYREFLATEQAKARAETAIEHATEAEIVVECLSRKLDEERAKVAALEAIAGPYVDPSNEPTPCFNEVTHEIGLPDAETTQRIPVMHLVAKQAAS
jgi:hypothetical protein